MFETHKLNDEGFSQVKKLKTTMHRATVEVLAMMPDSREKALFITKLEEAMFFGTKALAAKPENHTGVMTYEV